MLLKTAIRLLLFRKAGEQLGLFDVPVPVKPYVRNGKVVPGHVATRKKRLAPKGKQPDLFGAAAPKDETVRLGRLGHFIEKHGGYRRLLSLLESFSPAQKDTLLASMAKLAGKSPAAILDILKTGARHEGPSAKQDDLFSEPVVAVDGDEKANAEPKPPAFTPTHELPDGTQVVAHADEPGVWVDARGDEYESEEAYPIEAEKPSRQAAQARLDAAHDEGVISADEHQAASSALTTGGPAAAKAALDRRRKADKLRQTARNLLDKATATQNADRQTNTARRARMAQAILERAAKEEATAKTMLNLADAIESGEARHVAGLNSMAAVEMMDRLLIGARHEYERAQGLPYSDSLKRRGSDYTDEEIRHLKLPKPGTRNDWIAEENRKNLARLARAGITSNSDLQETAREYIRFKAGRQGIDPIKAAEMALAGQKVGIDFFPTPKALADRMAELADIEPGMKVLEPSAGKGNLADAAKARGADVDVVEVSDALRNVLQTKGYAMVGRDFNDYDPGEVYDRIIMNPPFGNTDRQDAAHIQRAYQMLKPGGKLVSIAGEGVFIGSDQKAVAFRDWLNQRGAMIEKLPDNSFMDRAETHVTGAATRLVVIEKPAGAKQEDEAPRMRTYGWDAVKLSDAYTLKELDALRQQVEREHENPKDANGHPLENGRSSIYLYDKKGRQKLDKIGWAVYYKLDEKRRQEASKPGDAPQEGERNAEGLVFRDGRWRREDSPEARTAAIDDMLDAEEAQRGTLQKAFGLLAA